MYDGDSDDMAERYMIGNMEEKIEDADVISATSPLGAALDGSAAGDSVTYDAPNGSLTVKVLNVVSVWADRSRQTKNTPHDRRKDERRSGRPPHHGLSGRS